MDFEAARRAMVDSQVRTNDVTDLALIAAMLEVPREAFVRPRLAEFAYLDRDLPLDGADAGLVGSGAASRWLIKPVVLARLIQAVAPRPRDRVLVVGAGTGYSSAILNRLAASVAALEQDAQLARQARSVLPQIGAGNVAVVDGPLTTGWPATAPHDVILIDGGVELVIPALRDQLAPGGRMAAVVRNGPVGKGTLFISDKGMVSGQALFDAVVPVLPGFALAPAFVF